MRFIGSEQVFDDQLCESPCIKGVRSNGQGGHSPPPSGICTLFQILLEVSSLEYQIFILLPLEKILRALMLYNVVKTIIIIPTCMKRNLFI